uniref:Uncharacterized protein n=1 Tax=Globodera rostochiensis TaxID=31243 RepID=A0A914HAQ5_GLORO
MKNFLFTVVVVVVNKHNSSNYKIFLTRFQQSGSGHKQENCGQEEKTDWRRAVLARQFGSGAVVPLDNVCYCSAAKANCACSPKCCRTTLKDRGKLY